MATHLIAFSSSLRDDAWRPPSTQCAHSASLNPASVLLECMCIPPHVRGVCLRLAHRQGRRERLRVGSWRASFRGDRDRDDGGQDAEGEGAERHRLDFCRGFSDGYADEPSGGVWLHVTGAHQHHHLAHLDHLVVHLEQVEFGDATGLDASRRRTGGSCCRPVLSQLHCHCPTDAILVLRVVCVGGCGERRVGVTLARRWPDRRISACFGAFVATAMGQAAAK